MLCERTKTMSCATNKRSRYDVDCIHLAHLAQFSFGPSNRRAPLTINSPPPSSLPPFHPGPSSQSPPSPARPDTAGARLSLHTVPPSQGAYTHHTDPCLTTSTAPIRSMTRPVGPSPCRVAGLPAPSPRRDSPPPADIEYIIRCGTCEDGTNGADCMHALGVYVCTFVSAYACYVCVVA